MTSCLRVTSSPKICSRSGSHTRWTTRSLRWGYDLTRTSSSCTTTSNLESYSRGRHGNVKVALLCCDTADTPTYADVANQSGDAVEIERQHRQNDQIETRIKQVNDIGDARFPFNRFLANAGWFETMLITALLLGATQGLLLDGDRPRLRHTLLSTPTRLVHRARQSWLRLPDAWPWTDQLLAAYRRLDHLEAAVPVDVARTCRRSAV